MRVVSHSDGVIRPWKGRETHLVFGHEEGPIERIAAIIACKREPTSVLSACARGERSQLGPRRTTGS